MKKPIMAGVPRTAFLVVKTEHLASQKFPELWPPRDSLCQILENQAEIIANIPVSADDMLYIAIRKKMIADQIKTFLDSHPETSIVNLGCGLSPLHERYADRTITWFDLDVPEIIHCKHAFFSESEKYQQIAQSVMDFSWMNHVPKDKPVLFILEGLLPYFPEKQVKHLIEELMRQFPQQELILHAISKWRVHIPHRELKKNAIQLFWGISGAKDILQWSAKLHLIQEAYPYAVYASKWSLKMKVLRLFPCIRRMDQILHLRVSH